MCDQFDAVYINLDRSEDRKQSFEAQDAFAACGMRRLAAVDGRTLDTSKAEGAPLWCCAVDPATETNGRHAFVALTRPRPRPQKRFRTLRMP